MDWNNGTIFRVFVNAGDDQETSLDQNAGVSSTVDLKVDIAQGDLTGNVFVGIENFVIKPRVSHDNLGVQNHLQNFWASRKYLQFESYQLAPYIDYTSQHITSASNGAERSQNMSRNTQVFARLPLVASPTLGNALKTTEATFAGDRVINKDSVLYEMRNNPLALSNGRLRFRILDEYGEELPSEFGTQLNTASVSAILSLAFTLVIYKPRENYP